MKKGFLFGLLVVVAALAAAPLANAQSFTTSPVLSQSTSPAESSLAACAGPIVQNSDCAPAAATGIACGSGGNNTDTYYLRRFRLDTEFGILSSFNVSSVDIAIETATMPQSVSVFLKSIPKAAAMLYANMTTLNTAVTVVPNGASLAEFNVPITGTIADPTLVDLIVEYRTPDNVTPGGTGTIFPGANAAPETFDAFIAAPDCGLNNPVAFGAIGFPNNNHILAARGAATGTDLVVTCTPQGPPITIPAGGGDYFYTLGVTNNGAAPAAFDIWIEIDGNATNLTFGPYSSRTLGPGGSLSRLFRKNVPPGALAGIYTHTCEVGPFATAEASGSFTFTKSGPAPLHGSSEAVVSWPMDEDVQAAYVNEAAAEAPTEFVLDAAYPNPFNPEATFRFAVSTRQNVRADLVNVLGRVVATLFEGNAEADEMQTVRIDGAGLPSGTYVVRLVGETFSETQRVTLLK